MINKYAAWTTVLNLCVFSAAAQAQEISLKSQDNVEMAVSIYNQNLAMVKDVRKVTLKGGDNLVAFEGVAQQMKPETALLKADGAKVLEQNYEYDLLNTSNILDESIGQEVRTVMTNPANGDNIFSKATIISSAYGNPLLKFSYGIEANFPGRVVFEKLPENLRVQPTLVAKLDSEAEGDKKISLNYLTNGISWQANYVAEVSGEDKLNWQGWITLNNQSGADYKNAEVQLISGDVKQADAPRPMPRMMNMMAKSSYGAAMDTVAESATLPAMSLSEYYVYSLPFKTDIMDKQSKQVSLMEKDGVKYSKLYRLKSPLYVGPNNNQAEFERANPSLIYNIVNSEEDSLGLPMPAGNVRFYEKNSGGNLQFIGAAEMPQLANGAKAELAIGEAFDLYADGKVLKMQKLSDKMFEADVEVTFHNAKKGEQTVEFVQEFYTNAEIVKESIESVKDKARQQKWQITIPAEGKTSLTYQVRLVQN